MRIAHDEHAVEIVIPVTGNLVEIALRKERCFGQLAALGLLIVLNPALEELNHSCALRQHDRESLTDVIDRREVAELSADLIVIAVLCLLKHIQMLFELFLLRESNAVNARELLVILVALPVCTRT